MTSAIDEELLAYAEELGFGEVHLRLDPATGMRAIIAIHSTKFGPALGGCRFVEYPDIGSATRDALRLARGMSYKSIMANLPLGGGKGVIIKPKNLVDREALFGAYGRFVNELGGRYITAMDSGSQTSDMDIISRFTPYVANTSKQDGDPAPCTALGVYKGIKAAVKHKLKLDGLKDVRIALQGLGHVGYRLAELLHEAGAKLTVCDRNPELVKLAVKDLKVQAVAPEEIYSVDCDVFSPCALGAIINDETIPQLKAAIIAGGANNQLAEPRHGDKLHEMGILFIPDYVINSGGLIFAYAQYKNASHEEARQHTRQIFEVTLTLLERALHENKATYLVADQMAEDILSSGGNIGRSSNVHNSYRSAGAAAVATAE